MNKRTTNIWESMFDVLVKFKDAMVSQQELGLPLEAAKSALASCYFGLVWDFKV